MSQVERLYKIDKMLRGRIAPSRSRLTSALEISEATLKRDIEYMRSRLGAPIHWSREANGYRYEPTELEFTLPGLWFSANELRALLVITGLIDQIQPGFLRDQISPFRERLKELTERSTGTADSFSDRICFIPTPVRLTNPDYLEVIACATLTRRRVEIEYESRSRGGAKTKRLISPARLIYYRNQWYCDAWCHYANAERRFAIDAVLSALIINEKARELLSGPNRTGYGIFAGVPTDTAVLQFNEKAAPWIRTAQWHPDQKLTILPGGEISLEVPFSQPQEILMDILRYGADVQVVAPPHLRELVADTLNVAAGLYRHTKHAPKGEMRTRLKLTAS
jgi:predicted DNA-binding transcriptional regulator YafY